MSLRATQIQQERITDGGSQELLPEVPWEPTHNSPDARDDYVCLLAFYVAFIYDDEKVNTALVNATLDVDN